jgi:hypothetical protein
MSTVQNELVGICQVYKKGGKGLTRMTSSLNVTWVVNNMTPDLELDKQ